MSQLNDLLMPKLGLTMTEGMLAEWCAGPGDTVKEGDVIFIVETEKVATEILAQGDGTIGEILVSIGETVPVGAVVARWTGPGQARGGLPEQISAASEQVAAEPVIDIERAASDWRLLATPLARRMAREHGLELTSVTGTGPRGRIKAADIRAAVSLASQPQLSAVKPPPAAERKADSGIAQSMARRMVEAKQQAPHFYLAAEADVSELLELRKLLNDQEDTFKLTLNHFVIAAVARAMQAIPEQNRIWADGGIAQFQSIDVGIAVSTERGLMAPVLHDLAGCSLDEVARRAGELVKRTREGRANLEDMQGGAITISNAGMFNVTYMTPIINLPQSAILGVGSIREVFRPGPDRQPQLHHEMGLVLAGDHRLHDGASGLRFLNCVMDLLQAPLRLLRDV